MNIKLVKWEDLKYLKQIRQFTLNLQKGDLGLSQIIQYGFGLYGRTKTGKTATGHILSGNPVKGERVDGQDMIKTTTSRNSKAKIGNTGNSQTLLPNFFQVQLKNGKYAKGKVKVVDTPGYGDSLGILRVLAIGYFHFRLYSKIKNMKFIICFQRSDISNTAQTFIDTMKSFTSYFVDYEDDEDIRRQIWKSCAFLITKVDEQTTLEDLKQRLMTVSKTLQQKQKEDKQYESIIQFTKYIIKQQRLFFIKKVKQGQQAQQTELLEKIDKKISTWYSRSNSQKNPNEIDMTPIAFNLAKNIIVENTKEDRNRYQFGQLITYYNKRIDQFVSVVNNQIKDIKDKGSLGFVINELVKDAMGNPDSHEFLKNMDAFKQKYYNQYDNTYRIERQKKQKQLFALKHETHNSSTNPSFSKKDKYNQKSYIVKKFEVLSNIEGFKKEISKQSAFQQRSLQWLDKIQNSIYLIIKQFNKVSYKLSKRSEIIYKYGYIIHRIIEEAKLFTNLFQIGCSQENKLKLQDNGKNIIDFLTPLVGFMGVDYVYQNNQLSTQKLKAQYIKKFELTQQSLKTLVINESLIDFFTPKTKTFDQQLTKKNTSLVYQYSQQILAQSQEAQEHQQLLMEQKQKLIIRLCLTRINCQSLYHNRINEQDEKNQNIMLIRKITNNLGRLLESVKRFDTAKKVYDTIKYVDSVCRIFKQQVKIHPKDIDLRIQFAKYLSEHFRQYQAMNILQQAFEYVKNKAQLDVVTRQITELKLRIKDIHISNSYQNSLFDNPIIIEGDQKAMMRNIPRAINRLQVFIIWNKNS